MTSLRFLAAAALLAALRLAMPAGLAAQARPAGMAIESLPLHLDLAGMRSAQPPHVLEGSLVLSVSGPFRHVAAAFANEGFAKLHPYEVNRQGVFVLAFPIPLKRAEPLEYRIVVDGVWTVDPSNPERRTDPSTGLQLSIARVPLLSDLHLGSYKLLDEDGKVARFLFRGASGESVTVCGDFDNWDPFIHALSETTPGIYQLDLPLPPGRHYYAFVYRGQPLSDPLNPLKAATADGREVSVLDVARD